MIIIIKIVATILLSLISLLIYGACGLGFAESIKDSKVTAIICLIGILATLLVDLLIIYAYTDCMPK